MKTQKCAHKLVHVCTSSFKYKANDFVHICYDVMKLTNMFVFMHNIDLSLDVVLVERLLSSIRPSFSQWVNREIERERDESIKIREQYKVHQKY